MTRVLFVCLGNICRSPMAEGIFRSHVARAGLSEEIDADSAGTYAYHSGEGADRRATETAARHGIDLRRHRARRVERSDFQDYDHLFAMDSQNYDDLLSLCPRGAEEKVERFLALAPHLGIDEVPDPYYGGEAGFERVFAMLDEASRALLARLRGDSA